MAAPNKRKDDKAETRWSVLDKNAYPTASNPSGFREHATRDGTTYKLHHKKETAMPMRHAMDFLVDESFVVVDHEGEIVRPAPPRGAQPRGLPSGSLVANLAELTDQALLLRARRVDPNATKNLGRDGLIAIIEGGTPAAAQPAAEEDGEGDAAGGEEASLIDDEGEDLE